MVVLRRAFYSSRAVESVSRRRRPVIDQLDKRTLRLFILAKQFLKLAKRVGLKYRIEGPNLGLKSLNNSIEQLEDWWQLFAGPVIEKIINSATVFKFDGS